MKRHSGLLSLILAAILLLSSVSWTAIGTAAEASPDLQPVGAGLRLLGDADEDDCVSIFDATRIQRYLVGLCNLSDSAQKLADTDLDDFVTIMDATRIQRYLAGYENFCYLGENIDVARAMKEEDDRAREENEKLNDDPTAPTEPVDPAGPTEAPMSDFTPQKGVDISYANGDVDMNKIKNAGYTFVMIRCGYGGNLAEQDDIWFERNVQKCEAAGLPWGTYLYSYAMNTTQAKNEVQHVLRLLKGKRPTLPVAFDMEDGDGYKSRRGFPSNQTLCDICTTFLSEIEAAGYYPILYTGLYWLNHYITDTVLLSSYDIWVAQWYTECEYMTERVGMWQYGGEVCFIESNSIPGVGVIDKNMVFKDYPTIIKSGGYNNWPPNTV